MFRSDAQGPVVALLDRFTGPIDQDAVLASVRAELERLCNTRQRAAAKDEPRTEGVISYGIPDLSTYSVAIEGMVNRLTSQIETAIRTFEPRLSRPNVQLLPDARAPDRLDLIINARLGGEPVEFGLNLARRP